MQSSTQSCPSASTLFKAVSTRRVHSRYTQLYHCCSHCYYHCSAHDYWALDLPLPSRKSRIKRKWGRYPRAFCTGRREMFWSISGVTSQVGCGCMEKLIWGGGGEECSVLSGPGCRSQLRVSHWGLGIGVAVGGCRGGFDRCPLRGLPIDTGLLLGCRGGQRGH